MAGAGVDTTVGSVRAMTFKLWMQRCGNFSFLKEEVAGMQRAGIGGDKIHATIANRFQEYHCIHLNLLQTIHIEF